MRALLMTLAMMAFLLPLRAGEGAKVEEIAERMAAATVGVYCRVGEFDRYYGSGVVVAADGWILTSTTAVPAGAEAVEVYFADHSRAPATVVETHAEVEAALLKVERAGLASLPINPAMPGVGEPAYASGNVNNVLKLGDGAAFSAGVVSSVYQLDNADVQSGYRGRVLETSCAVNPGTDGGPLVDGGGRVVGIISRGFSLRRWQGVAVPLGEILPRFAALSDGRAAVATAPLFPGAVDGRWRDLAAKFRPALVSLRVTREYPPERIPRRSWDDFRAAWPGWARLDATERRRATADFFALDSVLAANQMIRRPDGPVTGVLVSPEGHILTSAFNVQGNDQTFVDASRRRALPADVRDLAGLAAAGAAAAFTVANPVVSITATLHDGRSAPAEVVSFHQALGVALLKIPITDSISYLDIAAAGAARTGEEVALLGAAPWSVNTGIVSAGAREGGRFFQFDARLNYANSGGLVVSRSGRFLGVAGAPLFPQPVLGRLLPFTPAALNQPSLADFTHCPNSGVGLAAQAGALAEVLPAMRGGGRLGAAPAAKAPHGGLRPTRESAFGGPLAVAGVAPGSPAARAGARAGDVVLEVDRLGLRSWKEFDDYLADKRPGDAVSLKVRRPAGAPALFLNGRKVATAADLEALVKTLRDGEAVRGEFRRPSTEEYLELKVE